MPKSRKIASRGIPGTPKIDSKSLPGTFRAPLGAQEAPRDHPERSRHAPGSSWDRRGSVRERFRVAKIDAEAPPGAKRASFLRAPHLRTVYRSIIRCFLSIFGLFTKCKNAPMYRTCQSKSRFDTSQCEAKRSRDATLKNTENRSQNRSESVENRVSGPLGRPFRIGISGISGISGVPDASRAPDSPDFPEIPESPDFPPRMILLEAPPGRVTTSLRSLIR